MFDIKIVTDNDEILLKNLNETDVCEIFTNAYKCIYRLEPIIKFTEDIKVDALSLSHFYINK